MDIDNTKTNIGVRIAVPTDFEAVFSHFYYIRNNTSNLLRKNLLPTFQTILVFCFGKNVTLTSKQNKKTVIDKCIVLGPIKHVLEYELASQTSILVANFKHDAFYRFFGTPIASVKLPANPDELIGDDCFTYLWSKLKNINTSTEQVDCLLDFCKPYLRRQNQTSILLSRFDDNVLNPIKYVAHQTNQTERNVQIKQKKQFGYSSKEIIRYQRFLKAINLIEKKLKKMKKLTGLK